MMKYVYPILLYIYQIYTTMAAEKEGRGRIDGAMIGDFLETPWLINIWRYHLVLIGVGSFFPDMLFMNQLGAHME